MVKREACSLCLEAAWGDVFSVWVQDGEEPGCPHQGRIRTSLSCPITVYYSVAVVVKKQTHKCWKYSTKHTADFIVYLISLSSTPTPHQSAGSRQRSATRSPQSAILPLPHTQPQPALSDQTVLGMYSEHLPPGELRGELHIFAGCIHTPSRSTGVT